MSFKLKNDTLSVHVLNVGDGDSLVVELPEEEGVRSHIVVDCARADKTIDYLQKLGDSAQADGCHASAFRSHKRVTNGNGKIRQD